MFGRHFQLTIELHKLSKLEVGLVSKGVNRLVALAGHDLVSHLKVLHGNGALVQNLNSGSATEASKVKAIEEIICRFSAINGGINDVSEDIPSCVDGTIDLVSRRLELLQKKLDKALAVTKIIRDSIKLLTWRSPLAAETAGLITAKRERMPEIFMVKRILVGGS